MHHDTARRTSDVIKEIIQSSEKSERISIAEFVVMLGTHSFYLTILIFSLPNSLPVPGIPGFSTITGFPIILISLQMLVGREFLWLPQGIGKKSFSRRALSKMLQKALPFVENLERYLKPRLLWLRTKAMRSLMGLVFLILACIISLPIPGGNFLPGLSMSLIAIAILQRDGLFLLVALAFAAFSSFFMYALIVEFLGWASGALQKLF